MKEMKITRMNLGIHAVRLQISSIRIVKVFGSHIVIV